MPDNNSSAPPPEPEASPGEFDFAKSETETPRMRRRSLKAQPQTVLKPANGTAFPARDPDKTEEAQKSAEPSPLRPGPSPSTTTSPLSGSTGARIASTSNPTTSPHGTRPATLYYSSGARKDKEETPPMKSTPTATPTPSPTTQPARSTASSIRPTSVVDYRTNVERQAREQKSVGGVLAILVYTLIGLFVVGASLAGYGAYTVSKQLHKQSVTVDDLDKRLSDQNQALADQLKNTMTTLSEAQAQIGRQQELILKQQESISRLLTAAQDNAAAIRQERQTRAGETASLRERVRDLEYRGPTTQKY